jgi:hypothetical protein
MRNFDSVCHGPAGFGCVTCIWTWEHTALSTDDLGVDPNNDPAEDVYSYYYYFIEHPEIRTSDLSVTCHYRGKNPTKQSLDSLLGTDVMRAICWKESSWRQFNSAGKPLRNDNDNGTSDWGCMQINSGNAKSIDLWDFAANISSAKSVYETMQKISKDYLGEHAPYTDDMLMNETLQSYNGGVHAAYYEWNENSKKWEAHPPNNYVALVRGYMASKPWQKSEDLL